MKVREAIRLIEEDGWWMVRQRGSHRQFRHPVKPGRVTISGHLASRLGPKTAASVFKQARLDRPTEDQ